ncbi:hypothetical protein GALMADRAFT_249027 [Galerina marginata CBS 339.88]|uniref:F-box domain-containing protein n=1 Tax=Galerina marginata (strain CBS 339.88) TaxID=685588 RepID=A0A067T5B4_GALM3|nr:hypothetical protein GALMADRAFT_249027 [Galerina marginata CBS 339.88]
MGPNTPSLAMRTKLALVLVSKSWRNVAVQMLYEHLVIRSPGRALAILTALEHSQVPEEKAHRSGFGQWTRHIEIYTFTRGSADILYLQTVFKVLNHCPNLRTLSGNWLHPLPIQFLDAISTLHGPTLSALYWNDMDSTFHSKSPTIATPDFLGSFKSLRVLDLRHFVGSDQLSWRSSPQPTLPRVQDLILSTHVTSLQIAAFLSLPSLRNLTLRTPIWGDVNGGLLKSFLKAHGASLISVDLTIPSQDTETDPDNSVLGKTAPHVPPDFFLSPDVCPHLETLTFPVTSPPIAPHTHHSLRHIGLRSGNMDGLYPDKPSQMRDHLMAINTEKYPKLELIQIIGFLVEAHTDSLVKDIFIWWVERFEAMGVDFLDGEGVLWAYTDAVIDQTVIVPPTKAPSLDSKDKNQKLATER